MAKCNETCVVYVVGGPARFEWRRTIADTREGSEARCEAVRRQGYRAMVVDTALSLACGLPETW